MNVYMLYHTADGGSPAPKLPITIFESEEAAIQEAKKQEGYGYPRNWLIREVPVFRDIAKEEVEGRPDLEKDIPDTTPTKLRIGEQVQIEGSLFFVEQYTQCMNEPPSAYLRSAIEFKEEFNRPE